MKAVIHHNHSVQGSYYSSQNSFAHESLWHRLMSYCDSQEQRRFFWAAISLVGHGTLITTATMATVVLTGNVFALLVAACFSMVAVVIVNLAALPLRYIIPVFLLSVLVDIAVMATAFTLWLN